MYIVLGGCMCILGVPSVSSCCTLWISASYCVFVYGKYRKSRLCRTWACLDITRFCEEQRQLSSEFAWLACPKTVNRTPIAGCGRFRHNLHISFTYTKHFHNFNNKITTTPKHIANCFPKKITSAAQSSNAQDKHIY